MRIRIGVLVAVVVMALATVAAADDSFHGFTVVKVVLNGQEVTSDVPAVNFYGRTVLPVRAIAEAAGLSVDKWDADTNTVYLSSGLDQAVATVNGQPVSKLDLYNRMVAEQGTQTLETIITEKLVDQEAAKAGVTVSDDEIDAEITRIKTQIGGDAKFQAALQSNNMTLDELRNNVRTQLKVNKVLRPQITVNDNLLEQYFTAHLADFDKRTVHARHILVKTLQEANDLKAQLDQGADFATLAKEKSIDPTAKTNGGDLGTFGHGVMVPEFEKVVFSLKSGEVSAPFQSQFGWHIAQVLEINGAAPDFDLLKDQITDAYVKSQVAQMVQPWLAKLRQDANIVNNLKQK